LDFSENTSEAAQVRKREFGKTDPDQNGKYALHTYNVTTELNRFRHLLNHKERALIVGIRSHLTLKERRRAES